MVLAHALHDLCLVTLRGEVSAYNSQGDRDLRETYHYGVFKVQPNLPRTLLQLEAPRLHHHVQSRWQGTWKTVASHASAAAADPAAQPFLFHAPGGSAPREMAPRKVPHGGAPHAPHGCMPHVRCFGRGGIVFITVLAFPTLLFVALSRNPSLAADSGNTVAGHAPSLLGRGSDPADIELPHELPTPDDDAHHKKTLNQIADLVTGARHTVYEFKTKSLADGKDVSLSEFKSNVAIVVNVASNCGYTDVHYRELEALYKKYQDRGFTVLAFPSNDFGNQEPGTPAEIVKFARETKHASFPLFEKVHVNGKESHALFAFLKDKFGMKEIPWNFQKFLIDRNGHPVHQYPSQIDPMALENDILKLLAA